MLLSIQGGSNLGIFEINDAAQLVKEAAHPEANIIFGTVIDDTLGDEVRVTVIAAGFDSGEPTLRLDARHDVACRRPADPPRDTRGGRREGARPRERAGARPGVGRSGSTRLELRLGLRRRRPRHPRLPEVVLDPSRDCSTLEDAARRGRRRDRGCRTRGRARSRRDHPDRRDEVPPAVADRRTVRARRPRLGREPAAGAHRRRRRSWASATDLRWHFIGQAQTNKATVDPGRGIRRALGRPRKTRRRARRGRRTGAPALDVLLQVNLTDDPARGGVAPEDSNGSPSMSRGCRTLRLRGVMAVAPLDEEPARGVRAAARTTPTGCGNRARARPGSRRA